MFNVRHRATLSILNASYFSTIYLVSMIYRSFLHSMGIHAGFSIDQRGSRRLTTSRELAPLLFQLFSALYRCAFLSLRVTCSGSSWSCWRSSYSLRRRRSESLYDSLEPLRRGSCHSQERRWRQVGGKQIRIPESNEKLDMMLARGFICCIHPR